MPTYGYECLSCKEQFETVQRITEDALKVHDKCGGELRRLLYPVGIVFKGPGFYVNDYAKKSGSNGSAESKSDSGETKSETKAEASTDTKTDAKADAKTETKTETKTESKPAATTAT